MTVSRLIRPADTRVRAKRIAADGGFFVESRTIGTPMVYNLTTANLSRTGLLLAQGNYKAVPFQLNTLLELTIDPRGTSLPHPVYCVGKIVRMTTDDDGRKCGYGVQIVQMDVKDLELWERTVAAIEKSAETPAELEAAGEKLLPPLPAVA